MTNSFDAPSVPFFGAAIDAPRETANAVIFGAPHGTPYPTIPNEPFATAPNALRDALAEDSGWEHHWDFDLDGPILGDPDFALFDAGNLRTNSDDGPTNRAKIRKATSDIVANGGVPIMIGLSLIHISEPTRPY